MRALVKHINVYFPSSPHMQCLIVKTRQKNKEMFIMQNKNRPDLVFPDGNVLLSVLAMALEGSEVTGTEGRLSQRQGTVALRFAE